ncbi:MAG TPA: hypothetical protein VER17_16225 [Tepidisphaeraceae bacterium]|nr:hypothetical protein [Tepidisphaeraceae bacterium]
MRRALLLIVLMCCTGGCGLFRPIPAHGGGKRFDEEQRVVAAAVRHAVADMDLAELEGKKVAVVVELIAQDGGGTVSFPGLSSIGAGIGGNIGEGNVVSISPGTGTSINDNSNNGVSGNVGIGIRPEIQYAPSAMSSGADGGYFRAALEMKARHAGVRLTPAGEAEATLYVLVDVLGTNRSHYNNVLMSTDKLVASCECTYYAVEPKGGQLMFRARRASSASGYTETRGWGIKGSIVDRSAGRTQPTSMPVDAERKPTTQPAPLAKKSWLDELMLKFAGAE